MEKICESFREHAMKIINLKKKKLKLLTNKLQELYENTKNCIVKKSLKMNLLKIKIIVKLEIIVITHVITEVLHIIYVI